MFPLSGRIFPPLIFEVFECAMKSEFNANDVLDHLNFYAIHLTNVSIKLTNITDPNNFKILKRISGFFYRIC